MAKEAHERDVANDLILTGASEKQNSSSPARTKRSADPRNKYWKAIQKKVKGNGLAESTSPESVATLLRLISTRAATAIATMERNRPIPIRWSIMMNTTGKMGSEAGGTFKEPSFVFIVAACWTENVFS
ncbi:hypothetical protein K7X08_021098 [Anisodus acutangulus]|uniref:Uncharacterized protein n=1 Tax=Anisodus acutangulus TaxID=402998 RepID=A0A9Q1RAH6_9SOLA|nr:hypothetical protein K7X08_021098 [Anisodus acutangulus]